MAPGSCAAASQQSANAIVTRPHSVMGILCATRSIVGNCPRPVPLRRQGCARQQAVGRAEILAVRRWTTAQRVWDNAGDVADRRLPDRFQQDVDEVLAIYRRPWILAR